MIYKSLHNTSAIEEPSKQLRVKSTTMKTTELAALLFVALWLQYISKVASVMSPITVEYETVPKIKKPQKTTLIKCKLFPKMMTIEAYPRSHDAGIQYDHVQKKTHSIQTSVEYVAESQSNTTHK